MVAAAVAEELKARNDNANLDQQFKEYIISVVNSASGSAPSASSTGILKKNVTISSSIAADSNDSKPPAISINDIIKRAQSAKKD